MGVIESLQLQAEEMENNSEESSAKGGENIKLDEKTEVSKPCDSSEEVLKEINEVDLNPPHKRMKSDKGEVVVNMVLAYKIHRLI